MRWARRVPRLCPPYTGACRSIDLPQTGRCQLQQMPVGIAAIGAVPAARPIVAALDGDVLRTQPRFPGRELLACDPEGDVQGPAAVVRRNSPAWHPCRFERGSAPEQQQDVAPADRECTQALVGKQRAQPQYIGVEPGRALDVVHVERGLEHTIELGHGHLRSNGSRARSVSARVNRTAWLDVLYAESKSAVPIGPCVVVDG